MTIIQRTAQMPKIAEVVAGVFPGTEDGALFLNPKP